MDKTTKEEEVIGDIKPPWPGVSSSCSPAGVAVDTTTTTTTASVASKASEAVPSPLVGSRSATKYSHTCGSFFAKCRCNDVTTPIANDHLRQQPPAARNVTGSTPSTREEFPTSAEINKTLRKRTDNSNSDPLGEHFLNHPEIPYPVPHPSREHRRSQDYPADVTSATSNNNIQSFQIPTVLKTENPTRGIGRVTASLSNRSLPPSYSDEANYSCTVQQSVQCRLSQKIRQFGNQADQAQRFFLESGIIGPMGNGATTVFRRTSDTADPVGQNRRNSKVIRVEPTLHSPNNPNVPSDYEYLNSAVVNLKKELTDLEVRYGQLHAKFREGQREVQFKEAEILKLQREVHKLKSVLQQTTCLKGDSDILTRIQEQHAMGNRLPQQQPNLGIAVKKHGVSAESSDSSAQPLAIPIKKFDKDFRSKQLIKDAIMDNDFLKHLDSLQVKEIVDTMYAKEFLAGTYVIKEGEAGAHLFVSAEGDFEVIQEGRVLGQMGPGKAFGELAILYNCTRTASIKVVNNSKVWMLDRRVFQQIMVKTGMQRLQDNVNFLKSVPLLHSLNIEVLTKIADVLEVEFYSSGAYIIRQGGSGDTFFLISSGSVKVTQRASGRLDEEEIRTLNRGDYFGEQALLKEDCRTASVIALSPGVECLTLDRESFRQLIGDLSEIKEKDYGDEHRVLSRPNSCASCSGEKLEYDYIKLDDLDVIATLGVGGFGRVELVQFNYDQSLTFALKCLKKQHIVDTQQQEHIFSEKIIMMTCRSPFICRMYKTFKDQKYVYMLLEACLGGEVWTILRDRGCFDDQTTRFITGCVVEAFDYLHTRGIIYRDLKPENLLLNDKGYVKLVDFGFSKRLGYSSKTWTFCGTPEYVSPETILNKGHDRAVDYWALGVLMYELLTGSPPFTASDPMKTYNLILKGIDMVDFGKHTVGKSAQSLIKKLCRDAPSERLGYQRGGIQDIKKHKWFQGFDWDGLKAGNVLAPIVQPIRSPCDTINFDCFRKDNDIPPDELSGWDGDF